MTVNGVGNKTFLGKISEKYQKANGAQNESGYNHIAGSFEKKSKDLQEEKKPDAKSTIQGGIQVDYRSHSGRISKLLEATEAEKIHQESTVECDAKHITYAQSDGVRVFAALGYTLKAQVVPQEDKVYVEEKNEDGMIKGYMVDPQKVPGDSKNPIELLAKDCWEDAKEAENSGASGETSSDDDAQGKEDTFEEAYLKFYEFVEDRVKNGPPKIQTGGAEFSIEEWDKLMEEVDGALDAFKEELQARIAKQKKNAMLSADTQNRELAISQEPEKEDDVAETTGAKRGGSFADLISGKKKAPYSYLADENGEIKYNGVIFRCDYKKNQITLGNVSNENDCIRVPLSDGGCLVVNRDNLGDLAEAIGMFSPEDVRRILEAIARDNQARAVQFELEINGHGSKE